MKNRKLIRIYQPSDITGLIPGLRGQRAFPTRDFTESDPFLMLDQIGPQVVGKDFKFDGEGHDHPHRGFETISLVFEGGIEHRDSMGNRSKLSSGSVQRMNAGSGIIHGGSMTSDHATARFHMMQIWVNNHASEKMSQPEIHNASAAEIPVVQVGGNQLRVIAGRFDNITGPIQTRP